MKKKFRRESLICRAEGDSKIYEASRRERLKVLKENHDQHFSGIAIGFLAPSQPQKQPNRHTVTVFGKQMVLNDDEYKRYQNAFGDGK